MKLIGYVRSLFPDDIRQEDIEQQERCIADYCLSHNHDLHATYMDELSEQTSWQRVVAGNWDGVVVVDPLVISENIEALASAASELKRQGKHLFVVADDLHLQPDDSSEAQLVDLHLKLQNARAS